MLLSVLLCAAFQKNDRKLHGLEENEEEFVIKG